MRVELIAGKWALCGHLLPVRHIKPGQTWLAASGSGRTVVVTSVLDDWVEYKWVEEGRERTHEKEAFAFQCRYCLELPSNEIPKELL